MISRRKFILASASVVGGIFTGCLGSGSNENKDLVVQNKDEKEHRVGVELNGEFPEKVAENIDSNDDLKVEEFVQMRDATYMTPITVHVDGVNVLSEEIQVTLQYEALKVVVEDSDTAKLRPSKIVVEDEIESTSSNQ